MFLTFASAGHFLRPLPAPPPHTHAHPHPLTLWQVRITISQFFDFDITDPETIQATIPAAALVANMPVVASPTFTMIPLASSVVIDGTLASGSSEVSIQAGLEPVLQVRRS